MKKLMYIFFLMYIFLNVCDLCISKEEENIVLKTHDNIVVAGPNEQSVERFIEGLKKYENSADKYAVRGSDYYDVGEYKKAEEESLKAIKLTKNSFTLVTAHSTLADVYEVTKRYELAIKEIDWLIKNVHKRAIPDLEKKKKELQNLLAKKSQEENKSK